jgi:hypothetical protein
VLTIYTAIIDNNDSHQEEMDKSEEHEELVIDDTFAANDEVHIAVAAIAAYNGEFDTDKNIVKEHTMFKVNDINVEGNVPCPMLRDGCNQDEFRSFTLQWRLHIRDRGELDYSEVRQHLLSCIDGTLEDAMNDALGYKINTSSVTDMMTELGKLAVHEPFTVEEIVTVVETMCMIPERRLIKQPDAHRYHPHSSLSEQTLSRFEDPALENMLAQEDPALKQMLAQEDPALKQMLTQEDQSSPDADDNTEQFNPHTTPANTQDQFLTAEDRITMTEEEVLDITCNLQMTINPTELFRGGSTPTLQEGEHEHHQGEESQVYVELWKNQPLTYKWSTPL